MLYVLTALRSKVKMISFSVFTFFLHKQKKVEEEKIHEKIEKWGLSGTQKCWWTPKRWLTLGENVIFLNRALFYI